MRSPSWSARMPKDMTHLLAHSPASVIVNRNWEEGMGSSLRFGVASLPPACDAVLVLLGDQVAVAADDLRRLASAWKGEESFIAASVYDQRVGVPAIFPRLCFSELSELRGDQGARAVLERNSYRLVRGTHAERSDRPRHSRGSRRAHRTIQEGRTGRVITCA